MVAKFVMLSIPISFEKGHGVFVCVCHRSCCVSRVCAENALMTPTPKRQTLFLLGNETGIGKKEKKNRKATWQVTRHMTCVTKRQTYVPAAVSQRRGRRGYSSLVSGMRAFRSRVVVKNGAEGFPLVGLPRFEHPRATLDRPHMQAVLTAVCFIILLVTLEQVGES